MHIEQALCFDNCNLVGIRVESVDVQFIFSRFEVYIAERLKTADGEFWELNKYAAIAGESLKVAVALTIEIWTHLFNLKISHIAEALCQSAFVASLAGESESFNQTATWEQLGRRADEFRKAKFVGEHTGYVRAARYPNQSLIFVCLYRSLFVNSEKFRMQRPLVQGEGQFADDNICVW